MAEIGAIPGGRLLGKHISDSVWQIGCYPILTLALRQRLFPLGPASSDGFARRCAAFLWGAPGRYCLSALSGSFQPSSASELDGCGVFLPSHITLISYAQRLEKSYI
jgi:hypothetical protein